MITILETERLILRQLEISDAKFIAELMNTPGWLEYIGDRNIHSEADAIQYLKNGPLKSYVDNGFGLWLVEEKKDKTPIGMCGILKRDSLNDPDIGFAFLPTFTGVGYAYESSEATLRYAKNKLKLSTLLAITVSHNERSIKLLEKIGLTFVKSITDPKNDAELLLYSLK